MGSGLEPVILQKTYNCFRGTTSKIFNASLDCFATAKMHSAAAEQPALPVNGFDSLARELYGIGSNTTTTSQTRDGESRAECPPSAASFDFLRYDSTAAAGVLSEEVPSLQTSSLFSDFTKAISEMSADTVRFSISLTDSILNRSNDDCEPSCFETSALSTSMRSSAQENQTFSSPTIFIPPIQSSPAPSPSLLPSLPQAPHLLMPLPQQLPAHSSPIPPPPPLPPAPPSLIPPPPPPPPLPLFFQSPSSNNPDVPVPPPPPPSQLSPSCNVPFSRQRTSFSNASFDSKTSSRLKKLQWHKLPQYALSASDNVWHSIANKISSDQQPKVNFQDIEKLFSLKNADSPNGSLEKKNSLRRNSSVGRFDTSETSAPEIYEYLDRKKCMNVSIILRRFQMSVDDIIQSAILGDVDGHNFLCTADQVATLIKALPEAEELERLRGYQGPVDKLGVAEQFCVKLSRIPGHQQKVEFRLLRDEYEQKVVNLKMNLEAVISCGSAILNSQLLQEILAMVLLVGNYLNSGSYAGKAVGFKLCSLAALSDLKSPLDNKTTLLHCVVQELETNGVDVSRLKTELQFLNESSQHPISGFRPELDSLKNSLDRLTKLSQAGDVDQRFQKRVLSFLELASKEIKELEIDVNSVDGLNEKLAKYFCEEVRNFKMEECFKNIGAFCDSCCRVKLENDEKKRLAEEAEKRRNERMKNQPRRDSISFDKKRASESCFVDADDDDAEAMTGCFVRAQNQGSYSISDVSKCLRRSRRRSSMKYYQQPEPLAAGDDKTAASEHEDLVDLLVSPNDMTRRRAKNLRNTSVESGPNFDTSFEAANISLVNSLDSETRERLPLPFTLAKNIDNDLALHPDQLLASSTPIKRSTTPSHTVTQEIQNTTESCNFGSKEPEKSYAVREAFVNDEDNRGKDEGFESDRSSGSQRSSVCSATEGNLLEKSPVKLETILPILSNNGILARSEKEMVKVSEIELVESVKTVSSTSNPTSSTKSISKVSEANRSTGYSLREESKAVPVLAIPETLIKGSSRNGSSIPVRPRSSSTVRPTLANALQTKSKAPTPEKNPRFTRNRTASATAYSSSSQKTTATPSITKTSKVNTPASIDNSEAIKSKNCLSPRKSEMSKICMGTRVQEKAKPFFRSQSVNRRSLNEKIASNTQDIDKTDFLVRGSARRKTIEPNQLSKNNKTANLSVDKPASAKPLKPANSCDTSKSSGITKVLIEKRPTKPVPPKLAFDETQPKSGGSKSTNSKETAKTRTPRLSFSFRN